MRERLESFGYSDRQLHLVLLVGFALMVFGIWVVEPLAMESDEKSAVTKALWLGLQRTPFIPDFTKGGKFYIYFLATSFAPLYVYLRWTGRISSIQDDAIGATTFFDAPEVLKQTFYDFVVVGRFASVLVGVVTIYLLYVLTRIEYGRRRAIFASVTLALAMAFVNTAHLATEDMLLTGLVTLTFLLLTAYRSSADERLLWAASVAGGLSVSTKATAAFVALPIAYFAVGAGLRQFLNPDWKFIERIGYRGVKCGLLGSAAYLLTTPAVFVYPQLYVVELFNESAAAFGQQAVAVPRWLGLTFNLARGFGLPLFILVAAGLVFVLRRLYRGRANRIEVAFLLFAVPYFLVIGSWQTLEVWYVLPLMPPLAMIGSESFDVVFNRFPRRFATVLVAGVLVFSLLYTGVTVGQMATDARIDSSEWIKENVQSTATVDTYYYPLLLPSFPDGVDVNQHWFNSSSDESFQSAKRRASCADPDYIVLTSVHYGPFLRNGNLDPRATQFYSKLLDEEFGYRVAATFGPPLAPPDSIARRIALTVKPETITVRNLRIVVLERKESVNPSCAGQTR